MLLILLLLSNYYNKPKYIETCNEKYTAVIVEPREHKALSYVLHNFLVNLPDNWNIIIKHGNKNENFVKNIIKNDLSKYSNRIITKKLLVDNLTIDQYNKLLKSKEFYDDIPTETFLIFQTDTIICDENKDLINEFLQYDYVGAPWKDAVGNGGLSLRRKSKTLEIISKCKSGNENEDVYFANPCVENNKPSMNKATEFSVESKYNENSFGVHKPWAHLSKPELSDKIQKCRSLKQLIALNM